MTDKTAGVGPVERGVRPDGDLLERLREGSSNWAHDKTMQEAADEIARLRSTQDEALTQTMLMWNAAWMELPESVRERCWPDDNPLASGIRLLLARELTPNAELTGANGLPLGSG